MPELSPLKWKYHKQIMQISKSDISKVKRRAIQVICPPSKPKEPLIEILNPSYIDYSEFNINRVFSLVS